MASLFFKKYNIVLYLFALCSAYTSALPAAPQSGDYIQLIPESWTKYDIDHWLPAYMTEHNITASRLLHDFPKSVGQHDMECSLNHPCTKVPNIPAGADDERIRQVLVLSALAHFNDLFRMVNRLYISDPSLKGRKNFKDTLRLNVDTFRTAVLNHTVPADDLAHVFFTPLRYIPNALPNEALSKVHAAAVSDLAATGFGYTWDDIFNDQNLEKTLTATAASWQRQYTAVVDATGPVTILNFMKAGQMLGLKYHHDLQRDSIIWEQQALAMFTRQTLSLVLEANGVFLHRASYDGFPYQFTELDLLACQRDSYSLVDFCPIKWRLLEDGNITRIFPEAGFFEQTLQIPKRVVYGKSWECHKSTNDADFKNNYKKPWQVADESTSLYITMWDGSSDGFDAHIPKCTFNLPVNDLPKDPRDSYFAESLASMCGSYGFEKWVQFHLPQDQYSALVVAADAWAGAHIPNQIVSVNIDEAKRKMCQVKHKEFWKWMVGMYADVYTNFVFNLLFNIPGAGSQVLKSLKAGDFKAVGEGFAKIGLNIAPMTMSNPLAPKYPKDDKDNKKNDKEAATTTDSASNAGATATPSGTAGTGQQWFGFNMKDLINNANGIKPDESDDEDGLVERSFSIGRCILFDRCKDDLKGG